MMTVENAKVFIVDDDLSVRKSLDRLIRSAGFDVETFASAQEFIERHSHKGPSCLVLDVKMPGVSGLELQEKLLSQEYAIVPGKKHANNFSFHTVSTRSMSLSIRKTGMRLPGTGWTAMA